MCYRSSIWVQSVFRFLDGKQAASAPLLMVVVNIQIILDAFSSQHAEASSINKTKPHNTNNIKALTSKSGLTSRHTLACGQTCQDFKIGQGLSAGLELISVAWHRKHKCGTLLQWARLSTERFLKPTEGRLTHRVRIIYGQGCASPPPSLPMVLSPPPPLPWCGWSVV